MPTLIKGVSIMPAYNATFRTYTHYVDLDIEADTTEQALWISTRAADSRRADDEVFFHSYECAGCKDVNEIEVRDAEGKTPQLWLDDDVALRNAAAELRDALEALVERDRAEAAASGFSDDEMTWLEDARRALALVKGGVT
jgi:hypothetical protein